MNRTFFVWLLLIAAPSIAATTVSSLDQVPGKIKNSAGAQHYAEQMNGDALPDGFGRKNFSTREQALALLDTVIPDDKGGYWGLIGMKAWPSQGNHYIVTACAYAYKDAAKQMKWEQEDKEQCRGVDTPEKIVVAVVQKEADGSIKLAAQPWIARIGENGENLKDIESSGFALTNASDDIRLGNLHHLDFAPYRLNNQTLAFGIRYDTQVGYAGGGAFDHALTLFAVLNGKLKPVLSVPVYWFQDIAGDWHKDGTRDHHISEGEAVLVMQNKQTSGFNNILYKQTSGFNNILRHEREGKKNRKKIYRWDAASQSYR